MKKVWSRCLKNLFGLTFNRMESYHPEHKLVYYKFLKKNISLAYVVNFRYTFNARPPVLLQMIFFDRKLSSKTSVAQNCAAFIVCWCYWWLTTQFSLRRPVLMDIRLKHLHKKDLVFIPGGIPLNRTWKPGYISVLHIQFSLLQREDT